ncbi:conserved membrane protein of unknown function [Hyphomicrobium sp. 1Nfss2.1]|uniref:hypothetical protein n=1 Tax=Hyphomicrobium sp. 1Nfss2.1 TaxID=3413936 RepID=UPI003C7C353E
MWKQLRLELEIIAREIGGLINEATLHLGRAVLLLWEFVRPAVVFALNILLALILLFEEWGWEPLSNLLARLARYPLWAKLERFIAGLPPYGALLALAIPSAVLIPAKLLGVYFLTTGHLISAAVVIFLAKIASTALIARIFLLTKPALMQIGWFARVYGIFVPWQEALFARVRASWAWRYGRVVKWRTKHAMHEAWRKLRPSLDELWFRMRPTVDRMTRRLREFGNVIMQRISALRRPERRDLPPPDLR